MYLLFIVKISIYNLVVKMIRYFSLLETWKIEVISEILCIHKVLMSLFTSEMFL